MERRRLQQTGSGGGTASTGGGTASTGGGSASAGGSASGGGSASAGGAASAGTTFVATLSGTRENPANASTATGLATVTLNAAEDTLTWTVTHTVAGATAAHIHNGLAFANGPVVFGFTSASSPIMGTAAISGTQVAELKAGRYYVNVHSPTNAGGEIRGQLLRTGEQLFRTTLSGANEVPAVVTTATGGVQVIVSADMTKVNCLGTFTGVTATVAHIHRAPAGMNGGVVIPFVLGTGTISCSDAAITATNLADLTGGNWYANVHSAANSGGEIRGQLAQP